jgi:hypothetical protein
MEVRISGLVHLKTFLMEGYLVTLLTKGKLLHIVHHLLKSVAEEVLLTHLGHAIDQCRSLCFVCRS